MVFWLPHLLFCCSLVEIQCQLPWLSMCIYGQPKIILWTIAILWLCMLLSQNALRSNLRASNFQKFPGGACPSLPHLCMRTCTSDTNVTPRSDNPGCADLQIYSSKWICLAIGVAATCKIVVVTVWLEQQSWHCYYSNWAISVTTETMLLQQHWANTTTLIRLPLHGFSEVYKVASAHEQQAL